MIKDKAYRMYITDSIYYYGQGKAIGMRYEDMFKPTDTRSAEEIAVDVIKKAGLRV